MTIADGTVRVDTVPDVVPGDGEVLIEVRAAGVNRADLLQVSGNYPSPPGAPSWPGLEVSGSVIAVGEGVDLPLEQEVCALLPGGGWAEFVTVDAGLVLPKPTGVSLIEAAGLPEVAATVHSNLGDQFSEPGQRALIHGASGGIGTFAVQYASKVGRAEVWATARETFASALHDLGASEVIDYRHDDFAARLRAAGGADVILDVIGAAYLEGNVAALRPDGTLVVIGLQKGRRAELDLGSLLPKRLTVRGSTLRGRPLEQKRDIMSAVHREVWPYIGESIHPVVDKVVPMERAADALQSLRAGGQWGKIVLSQ